MSTAQKLTTRDIIEQVIGCSLAAAGLYKLSRNGYGLTTLLLNYRNYMRIDVKKKHMISALVANPSLKELTFLHIFCNASKETFKNHFKQFNQTHDPGMISSYFHQCSSFEASVAEDGKKYKIICKPRYMNSIYMTSTLLENLKALEKGTNKKPFTALAYGQLQYIPSNKNLLFHVQSLTTCRQEIDQIWHIGFSFKMCVAFFLIGVVLGVSLSIIQYHQQSFRAYLKIMRQDIERQLQKDHFK